MGARKRLLGINGMQTEIREKMVRLFNPKLLEQRLEALAKACGQWIERTRFGFSINAYFFFFLNRQLFGVMLFVYIYYIFTYFFNNKIFLGPNFFALIFLYLKIILDSD